MNTENISVIGAAIIDVVAHPVTQELFDVGSIPMNSIGISYGGDALNESAVLSKLGARPRLISNVGNDDAGKMIIDYCQKLGIDGSGITIEDQVPTGINIVLSDADGERYFLTNPKSSLRTLTAEQITPWISNQPGVVSYASIFVSERMHIADTAELFRYIKSIPGNVLCADMTKAKHGECIDDLRDVLHHIDYIFPNEEEIALLTHNNDIHYNASRLVDYGVGCAVIKAGRRGCIIRTQNEEICVPGYPDAVCVDTTGAGDSFAGGFIYALSHGYSLVDAGCFACATASLMIEHVGTKDCAFDLSEVKDRCNKIRSMI